MITKTKFKEYTRCARYAGLERMKKQGKDAIIDAREQAIEFYQTFLEDENFLSDLTDEQLEVMMPYFNQLEAEAARVLSEYFDGNIIYSLQTQEQKYFERWNENYQFSCFVDAYVDSSNPSVVEVKATTSSKIKKLSFSQKGEKEYLFQKINNIYQINERPDEPSLQKKYDKLYAKLFDRYHEFGKYVFDLAIQAWIIESDIDFTHQYYLGILNHEYIYDGNSSDDNNIYNMCDGEEIVTFVNLTMVVKQYYETIQAMANHLETTLDELLVDPVPLGLFCERKKTTECMFFETCWAHIPKKNSIFTYTNSHHGFGEKDNKKRPFDLIHEGSVHMFDIPKSALLRETNKLQRRVHESEQPEYIRQKIIDGIDTLEFPLYHLDFESFPCPLPRFKGEKPYTQSVFQFSLHIQNDMDHCDKHSDHLEFCSKNSEDEREELIKAMVEAIGPKGSVIVWNKGFEQARLKELAIVFPKYEKQLLDIRDRCFDLMYLFKSNKNFYMELGYSEEVAGMYNFYHHDLQGSFSIKKVLPIFSDLTYDGMEVGNGMEAVITYARFPHMDGNELEKKYKSLLEYCKQDTWAMVELLQELNHMVKKNDA